MVKYLSLLLFCLLTFTLRGESIPEGSIKKFLLVTGCARSGTTYISELLQHCGLDIAHEHLGADGCASWPMAVDSDFSPWGPPAKGIYFEHIWHQVRNPLLVISSLYRREHENSWKFICREIPEIHSNDPRIVKCAKYWYYWNLAAEKKAEWTYRVEEIDSLLEEMSHRLGRPLNPQTLKVISKTSNHRGPYVKKFTWKSLKKNIPSDLFNNIQEMAHRYGYKVKGFKKKNRHRKEMKKAEGTSSSLAECLFPY